MIYINDQILILLFYFKEIFFFGYILTDLQSNVFL